MNIRINLYIAISATFSLVTFITFFISSELFGETLIFYLGILFSLSTFFLFLQLLRPSGRKAVFKFRTSTLGPILYLFTVISIVAVLFVPPYTGSMLKWMKIPAISWFRFFSSLLLATFLPGYFLLKILDRKNSISGAAVIVFSYLLSIFITFLTVFSILLTNNTISLIAPQVVLTVNLLLALVHCLINIGRERGGSLPIDLTRALPLFSILLTVILSSLIVMYYNFPLTLGDMWQHHAQAIQYSKGFPVYRDMLIPGYPYLYHIYLAALFSLSGIPSAITEQSLCVLGFMPVLAFYSAVKEWFKEKKSIGVPILATFLSILMGFGSIYAIYLNLTKPTYNIQQLLETATSKTYDICMRVIFLPSIVAPVVTVGLPIFLMLLYLIRNDDARTITRTLLMSILIVTGYLAHPAEIIVFLLSFFIYSLLFPRFKWDLNAGILLGLIFVALIDLTAPSQIYIFSMNSITGKKTPSLPFLSTFFLLLLGTATSIVKGKGKFSFKFLSSLRTLLSNELIRIWKYARWLLLYVYFMSIIIWLTILGDFDLWKFGGYSFTPFFIFPLRLGPVGLLAVLFIFAYLQDIVKDRRSFFFLTLIITGFLLEQLSNQFPLFYSAYRYATFTFLGGCVIAAYGIKRSLHIFPKTKRLLTNLSTKKNLIPFLLLFSVILPGMITTSLFYVNASYYSNRAQTVTSHELEALDYISQHLTTDVRVLTITTGSSDRLETFAGVNPVQNFKASTYVLLEARDPQIICYLLGSSKVKYAYMAQRDCKILDETKGLFKYLLPFFPVVFTNDEVTIYELPLLSPPDQDSSFGVLHIDPPAWVDDSFIDWSFDRTIGDVTRYGSSIDNGSFHIWEKSGQAGRTCVCYSLSFLSLNTAIYRELSFRYRVRGNYTWFSIVLLNSTNHWVSSRLHLSEKLLTTMTLSLPENQIITGVEVYVGTMDNAPEGTTAHGYLDYVKITPSFLREQEAFPVMMASMFHVPHFLFSTDVSKKPNQYALCFDGVDDYIEVSDSDSLDITDEITIEAWIYPNNVSGCHTVIGKRGFINGTEYCNYNLRTQGKRLKFYYKGDDGGFHSYMTDKDVFEIGGQYHIAATYISGDAASARLYINSEPAAVSWVVGTGNANLVAGAANLAVGCNFYIYDPEYFNGTMDEVRIFSRALSNSEVKNSFERGYARAESGCVLCQRMEDGTGCVIKDESGYGNIGEITGPMWTRPRTRSYETALYGDYYKLYIQNYSTLMLTYDPLDTLDLEGILDWISDGGTLIVPNTFGNAFFGHLLQLHQTSEIYEADKITGVGASIVIPSVAISPIVTCSTDVTPLLRYEGHSLSSGFIFEKKLGSGRILYVDLHPLVEAKTVIQTLASLKSNVDFIQTITGQLPTTTTHVVEFFPSYNLTSGETHIDGNLSLVSDFVSLKGKLNSIAAPYDPETVLEITVYGQCRVNIYNASVSIFPSNLVSHLFIEAKSLTGEIVADEPAVTLIKTFNGTIYTSRGSMSINLTALNVSIIVLSPSVEGSGEIVFSSLDVRVRSAVPLAGISREKAMVQGTVRFNALYTTQTIVMFSSYQFDGTVTKMAEERKALSIPWAEVLASPCHVLLLFSLFIGGIVNKRYAIRIRRRDGKDSALRGKHG